LTAGSYFARTLASEAETFVPGSGLADYVDELFDGVSCPANCDVTTGTAISAGAPGSVTANIDFALAVGGTLELFGNATEFVAVTDATNATGPLPDVDDQTSLTVGTVTFTTAPGGDGLNFGGGPGREWYQPLAGNDVALGFERLQLDFAAPVTAAGFYFVEPRVTLPPHGGTAVDSTYEITLHNNDGTVIRRYLFNASDDNVVFVGVQSTDPFVRMRIVDLSGNDDDEYFGEVFTAP
jgi:hypothetical protein